MSIDKETTLTIALIQSPEDPNHPALKLHGSHAFCSKNSTENEIIFRLNNPFILCLLKKACKGVHKKDVQNDKTLRYVYKDFETLADEVLKKIEKQFQKI